MHNRRAQPCRENPVRPMSLTNTPPYARASHVRSGRGCYGVRFALPFALDHVHIWLAEEDGGWTVIDTGLADQP